MVGTHREMCLAGNFPVARLLPDAVSFGAIPHEVEAELHD